MSKGTTNSDGILSEDNMPEYSPTLKIKPLMKNAPNPAVIIKIFLLRVLEYAIAAMINKTSAKIVIKAIKISCTRYSMSSMMKPPCDNFSVNRS